MKIINDVGDLLLFVKKFSQLPSEMLYRGQIHNWPLLPTLFRTDKSNNLRIERSLIKKLKLNRPILPLELSDYFDFLIFAQQHSMPTRLLDWTFSPLVALWFACFENVSEKSSDGIIFMLDSQGMKDPRMYGNSYFANVDSFKNLLDSIEELHFLLPGPLFDRLSSQSGAFTVFPNDLNQNDLPLTKLIIPAEKKESIIKELGKLKINEYSIYKDYDSLCRTIYWETKENKSIYEDPEDSTPWEPIMI